MPLDSNYLIRVTHSSRPPSVTLDTNKAKRDEGRIQSLRNLVRNNIFLYKLVCIVKGRELERRVRRELLYYSGKAKELGLSYSENNTARMLKQRLVARGLEPKKKGDFHILVAYGNTNWFKNSVISELEKFGRISTYDWLERGFDNASGDWVPKKRLKMNEDLIKTVRRVNNDKKIDCFFGYLSHWNTLPETIDNINNLGIFTVNISLDDKPSFRGKVKKGILIGPAELASYIDLNWTSSEESCVKYLVEGGIPIFMPEAANPEFYKFSSAVKDIDVSFVGRRYGWRPIIIDFLRKRGIQVQVFGWDWKQGGDIFHKQMINIWHRSKINLGLGGILYSQDLKCLKARDFEIPMSGGFYLTQYNPELESLYEIGKEIVCYRTIADLVEKIRYFLSHPKERERIAQKGCRRAINEHTWERRFEKIFRLAGLLKE